MGGVEFARRLVPETPAKFWVAQSPAIHGGGSSCRIIGIGKHLTHATHSTCTHSTHSTTEVTPSSSKGWKHFERRLKQYTWLVSNRDGNLINVFYNLYDSQGRMLLRSFDMLIFKNTKWPSSVHMLFVPKGAEHMFIDLGLTFLILGLVV